MPLPDIVDWVLLIIALGVFGASLWVGRHYEIAFDNARIRHLGYRQVIGAGVICVCLGQVITGVGFVLHSPEIVEAGALFVRGVLVVALAYMVLAVWDAL